MRMCSGAAHISYLSRPVDMYTYLQNKDYKSKAVEGQEPPRASWISYPIRELGEAESYTRALEKERQAMENIDVQTAEEDEEEKEITKYRLSKRKITPPSRFEVDEEDQGPLAKRLMPDMSDDTDTEASQSMQRPSHSTCSKELELPKNPPKTVPGQPCLQTYRLPSRAPLASPTSRAQSPSMSTKSLLPETLSPTFRGRTAIPPTVTGAEVRILTLLEKLMAKVDKVDHKINQVLMCLDTDALKEDVPLPEGVVLPVSTMEELNVLEDFIEEPSNRKSLVRKLSTIGGVNLQNAVRRTPKESMSDQLSLQFNWLGGSYVEGVQGKRALGTLNLKLVIYKAFRLNKDFENESDSNIEKWIKEWLRGASDRNGGRRRRASAITAATADPDEAVEQPRG